MHPDELAIRRLVTDWLAATAAGDLARVLSLMTEDVVFLLPGRAPMNKSEFAKQSRAPLGLPQPKIEAKSEIQEVLVSGTYAFMWTALTVIVTPSDGSAPVTRSGHTLSVLRKDDGVWRIARDANLLSVVQAAAK